MAKGKWWVGGNGNWSDSAHWSASGFSGPGGASVPLASEAVYLPASADVITLDVTAKCLSLGSGNFAGIITGSGGIEITNGSLYLQNGAQWQATGDIRLNGALGQIRSSGNVLPSLTLDGSAPSCVLTMLDDLTIAGALTVVQGSIDPNGFTLIHN